MTVVVGYVPTPEGLAAVEEATVVAASRGARLVVVNTGRDGDYSHSDFATGQDLDALDGQLTDRGVEHDIQQPTTGLSAAEEILATATAEHAQLIVIGLRRRSPVGKLITGSTAQHVLLDAACPVLAVKAGATTSEVAGSAG